MTVHATTFRRVLPCCRCRCPAGCAVDGVVDGVGGAVGSGPGDDPVGGHGQGPAAVVGEVVVFAADGHQVGDVGTTLEAPEHDVVDLAVLERDVAVVADAGFVHGA